MKITAFVDSHTVTLVGMWLQRLGEGEDLYVLGVGDSIVPGTSSPLVVPKASLEVILVTASYLVARTPGEDVEIPSVLSSMNMADLFETKTVQQRPKLTKSEKLLLGNPGRVQVVVGDWVVRKSDVSAFVSWIPGNRNFAFAPTPD